MRIRFLWVVVDPFVTPAAEPKPIPDVGKQRAQPAASVMNLRRQPDKTAFTEPVLPKVAPAEAEIFFALEFTTGFFGRGGIG